MAKQPSATIYLPELNRPNCDGSGTDKARLELNTYADTGRIWSCANVTFEQPDGSITFAICGDYTKTFPSVRGVRATQKALDTHHNLTFNNRSFDEIMTEIRAHYADEMRSHGGAR